MPQLISEGHRMLIFSQWTRCLDLLGCLLETMNLKFLRLDGSTSVSDRQSLIDEFNENMNIPVFLLSTRAGGMGKSNDWFNLFQLFDPWILNKVWILKPIFSIRHQFDCGWYMYFTWSWFQSLQWFTSWGSMSSYRSNKTCHCHKGKDTIEKKGISDI